MYLLSDSSKKKNNDYFITFEKKKQILEKMRFLKQRFECFGNTIKEIGAEKEAAGRIRWNNRKYLRTELLNIFSRQEQTTSGNNVWRYMVCPILKKRMRPMVMLYHAGEHYQKSSTISRLKRLTWSILMKYMNCGEEYSRLLALQRMWAEVQAGGGIRNRYYTKPFCSYGFYCRRNNHQQPKFKVPKSGILWQRSCHGSV